MTIENRSHCPIAFALDLFGDKWSLLILRDLLFKGRKHYQEFLNAGEEISTNILANRLVKLEEFGLIKKEKDPENKRQYIYTPTPKAKDLIPMLGEMMVWSNKYDPDTAIPPHIRKAIKKDKNQFIDTLKTLSKRNIMKTMSCDLCEEEFSAETFEDWFKQMKDHYMQDHADFMKEAQSKSKEEGMKWMSDMKAKFEEL